MSFPYQVDDHIVNWHIDDSGIKFQELSAVTFYGHSKDRARGEAKTLYPPPSYARSGVGVGVIWGSIYSSRRVER